MDKISDLKEIVINTLDLNKAQDIVTIDLKDKSSMADYMIIASGTSSRHIQSLSEQVLEMLKNNGVKGNSPLSSELYLSISSKQIVGLSLSIVLYIAVVQLISIRPLSDNQAISLSRFDLPQPL